MNTFARHLLVELHGCDPGILNDRDALASCMRRAAEAAGARVVAEVFHPYSPHGVTGVIVIEESHFSVHTWPEAGYAALDFYTCGDIAPAKAAEILERGLRAKKMELLEVHRGLRGGESGLVVHERRARGSDR